MEYAHAYFLSATNLSVYCCTVAVGDFYGPYGDDIIMEDDDCYSLAYTQSKRMPIT